MRIETVSTERFSMEYFRFGTGEKTLVILPGLSVQSVMGVADAVAEAYLPIQDAFTVYVFDRRSDLPPSYPVREMARDTAEAFRALGLEKVCLFGASQGGMIALVMAIEYPELVGKLVLGSSSAHVKEPQYRVLENWVRLAKAGDREGLYLRDRVLDSDATLEIAEKLDARADFRLYLYTGYGHAAFDTAPDYKQRILRFFES